MLELHVGLQRPVLVQLNRSCKGRANKRPTLTDLRELGDLENTADSLIVLYCDALEHADSPDKGLAELILGRQSRRFRLHFVSRILGQGWVEQHLSNT